MAAARRLCRASWRFALPASSRLEANSTLGTSQLSVCQRFGLSASPDWQQCLRSGEELGFGDVVRDCCSPRSHLSRVVGRPEFCSAIDKRNGRFVGSRGGNGRVCSDRFDDGAGPPWIVSQVRGLAAKAKKAKSSMYLTQVPCQVTALLGQYEDVTCIRFASFTTVAVGFEIFLLSGMKNSYPFRRAFSFHLKFFHE